MLAPEYTLTIETDFSLNKSLYKKEHRKLNNKICHQLFNSDGIFNKAYIYKNSSSLKAFINSFTP
jgi:hypothetical protein